MPATRSKRTTSEARKSAARLKTGAGSQGKPKAKALNRGSDKARARALKDELDGQSQGLHKLRLNREEVDERIAEEANTQATLEEVAKELARL